MKNFSGSNFDNRFAGELGWCDFFVAKLNEQTNKKLTITKLIILTGSIKVNRETTKVYSRRT